MRNHLARLCAFVLVLAAIAPVPARAANPLEHMAWLVGGLWTAQLPQKNAGHIELRYESVADGALLRFQTAFVGPAGDVTERYAGNFYADPSTAKIQMWYVSSTGEITSGSTAIDGDTMTIDLSQTGANGPQNFRVIVARKDADHYDWTLYAPDGANWKKMFGIAYARTPDPK